MDAPLFGTSHFAFEYDEAKYLEFQRICDVLIKAQKIYHNGKFYKIHIDLNNPNSWRAFFQHLEKEQTVVLRDDVDTISVNIFDLVV